MKRFVAGLICGFALCAGANAQERAEDREDSFKKWLNQDVVYIISREERGVFEKLSTDDEKQAFIEQFWRSRDPDPSTPFNEFKEEHYRRIAYANEKYHAGKPGWMTDRGMMYIKFGPPDRLQTNPTGGRVFRTRQEMIASDGAYPDPAMTALPYEVWEYRHIEGLGNEVAFEFVSKDGTSEYTLALSPEEKDALYYNSGSQLFRAFGRNLGLRTFGGSPLDKLDAYAAALRPLPAKPDETFVSAQVHFQDMPFEVTHETSEEDGEPVVDLEIRVPTSSLSFNKQGDSYRALVDIEIFFRDIRKVVMAHRADSVETRLLKREFSQAGSQATRYRTRFSLPSGRYLAEIWIKDVLGGQASFQTVLIVIPKTQSSVEQ